MTIFRTVLTATMFGQTVQNVLHFNDNGTGRIPSELAPIIETQWLQEDFKFFSHNGVVWNDIAVTAVAPTIGITFHRTVNIPGTGNAVAGSDIPVQCLLIKVQTGVVGKTGRGRIYAAGIPGNHHVFGLLSAAAMTSIQTRLDNLVNKFRAAAPPSGFTFGICPRGDPDDFKPCIGMAPRQALGTQRRRNYGVGI